MDDIIQENERLRRENCYLMDLNTRLVNEVTGSRDYWRKAYLSLVAKFGWEK